MEQDNNKYNVCWSAIKEAADTLQAKCGGIEKSVHGDMNIKEIMMKYQKTQTDVRLLEDEYARSVKIFPIEIFDDKLNIVLWPDTHHTESHTFSISNYDWDTIIKMVKIERGYMDRRERATSTDLETVLDLLPYNTEIYSLMEQIVQAVCQKLTHNAAVESFEYYICDDWFRSELDKVFIRVVRGFK